MSLSFPNETTEYRVARNALLDAEIALRHQLEEVAKLRRTLPPGGLIPEDYAFAALDGASAPLSSLFGSHDTLALYSFMYAPGDTRPCPACTSFVDGLTGLMPQITQRIAVAAVAAAPHTKLSEFVETRGWTGIPFFSAAGTDYQARYFGEDTAGDTRTFMNIFTKRDGEIRHFWGSEMERAELDGHPRHLDTLWPIWGLLDLTPAGRGTWFPSVFEASHGST
ncbi:MAG: DUF899 family protein [Pseudomonadota bacterium]